MSIHEAALILIREKRRRKERTRSSPAALYDLISFNETAAVVCLVKYSLSHLPCTLLSNSDMANEYITGIDKGGGDSGTYVPILPGKFAIKYTIKLNGWQSRLRTHRIALQDDAGSNRGWGQTRTKWWLVKKFVYLVLRLLLWFVLIKLTVLWLNFTLVYSSSTTALIRVLCLVAIQLVLLSNVVLRDSLLFGYVVCK